METPTPIQKSNVFIEYHTSRLLRSHRKKLSSFQRPVTAAPQCALCAWTYANGPRSFSSVRGQLVPLLNLLFRFLDRNVRALLESTAVILVDLLSIQKHLILIMKNSMR
jgi:hypothetical protein